ncbi:Crp/Fnr family transcriptional regulator [Tetragenococcus koreensis]|uniref:Crp/Fnr family transcriptional regulator n=1 Tax=Tetragenococcus koreensis TaxID=290335 RepID=UPI001F1EB735|nr:Crp/Fnr family transcriptional regulator [Tetragenococcus koreensis]MDN6729342.1 Crp/Fnr family transcriptional regulator [Alkalibacterium sp.]MCF1585694.1 Crp/Fnr family transcriptional regulator [Tetragenococcus koreensis]MCF1615327.1 Crp/Fnr family transcriptional regulator [Tetragenococcus koreensis]MCF1618687.1 Crp/Fnr family transcriptional regulator [Tetragenococcus koreensis]MCF1625116.1 Crp/Fnr family transcriptional regulator [Tetragenococcus koreensis]
MNNQELKHTQQLLNDMNLSDIYTNEVLTRSIYLHFTNKLQVIHSSDSLDALFFILIGKVFVTSYSSNGDKVIIDNMKSGEFFGDIELYSGKVSSLHNIVSTPNTIILKIPAKIVRKQLNYHIPYLNFMCVKLTEKLTNTSSNYSKTLLLPAKNKLARYITEQFELTQHDDIPFSVKRVSEILGISDRHLRRLIQELEKNELISKTRSHLKIIDLKTLYSLANL